MKFRCNNLLILDIDIAIDRKLRMLSSSKIRKIEKRFAVVSFAYCTQIHEVRVRDDRVGSFERQKNFSPSFGKACKRAAKRVEDGLSSSSSNFSRLWATLATYWPPDLSTNIAASTFARDYFYDYGGPEQAVTND